jgi:hypothetical protein
MPLAPKSNGSLVHQFLSKGFQYFVDSSPLDYSPSLSCAVHIEVGGLFISLFPPNQQTPAHDIATTSSQMI